MAIHRVPRVVSVVVPGDSLVDTQLRDLIILSATTVVFVLTLYILSLRVARQRALEAQLDDAYDEIASLRARLAEATRPPTQFARMRMRQVAVNRFGRLRLAAPRRTRITDQDRIPDRTR
ncbi:MAG TPA: hypothetical protein VEW95_02700 [Candidatus Limnocylindrales bacterium]|nr:hypothetical protein [Candidatus Limnocylindrales bacterium]